MENLQKNQKIFKTSIEKSPAGIIIVDAADMKLRVINLNALHLMGLDQTTSRKSNTFEIIRNLKKYKKDGALYKQNELPLIRAMKNGEIINAEEVTIIDNNGKKHYTLINAAPIRNEEDGK